jgi:glutaminyl-peptide cyclotransferase
LFKRLWQNIIHNGIVPVTIGLALIGLVSGMTACGADEEPTPTPQPIVAATTAPTATPIPLPTVGSLLPTPTSVTIAALSPLPLPASTAVTPRYTYKIVKVYPHDPEAFTQGLLFDEGILYESTGLNGFSSIRRVDLESGAVLALVPLPAAFFGEGISIVGDQLYQLTWQEQTGFIYNKETFAVQKHFSYPTEGWGITFDGERLIMSDGTARLYFWDPTTLAQVGAVDVYDENGPVVRLNELEYIHGEIFANIWQTDAIARIDPITGAVVGWIDLTGLLPLEDRTPTTDVLNGIAYLPAGDRLFVTGKKWPKLFEIRLVPQNP